jgi:hypothetical protein
MRRHDDDDMMKILYKLIVCKHMGFFVLISVAWHKTNKKVGGLSG